MASSKPIKKAMTLTKILLPNVLKVIKQQDMADCADTSYAMLHYAYERVDSTFKSMECV